MRYLKEYKIFESNESIEDVIQNLHDICSELTDIGFKISIDHYSKRRHFIVLKIKKESKIKQDWNTNSWKENTFYFTQEVNDTVLRIYQYMKDMGWSSKHVRISPNIGADEVNIGNQVSIQPDGRIRKLDNYGWRTDNYIDKETIIYSINMGFGKRL